MPFRPFNVAEWVSPQLVCRLSPVGMRTSVEPVGGGGGGSFIHSFSCKSGVHSFHFHLLFLKPSKCREIIIFTPLMVRVIVNNLIKGLLLQGTARGGGDKRKKK